MEDWLNESREIRYNLSSSGCLDFSLGEFLSYCDMPITALNDLYLGDNATRGSEQLRREICKSYDQVSIDEIMVANGTSEALFTFFNELLNEGDRVVVPFPAFQCLYQIPLSIGCRIDFLPLFENVKWRLDLDRLEHLVSDETQLIIINTPHNPIGWTLSESEFIQIAKIAHKHNASLLFDEHYRYLPLAGSVRMLPSGYDICRRYHEKVYATGSMIKCFGIVGIRIGWLVGDAAMIAKCTDYKDYLTHTIPSLTDYIAYLALLNKDKISSRNILSINNNLKVLNEFMELNQEFFEYVAPTGGVVCFPRLKAGVSSTLFCRSLFDKYGVSLLPGFAFEVEDHFRMNLGMDPTRFIKALDHIQECLLEMRPKVMQ